MRQRMYLGILILFLSQLSNAKESFNPNEIANDILNLEVSGIRLPGAKETKPCLKDKKSKIALNYESRVNEEESSIVLLKKPFFKILKVEEVRENTYAVDFQSFPKSSKVQKGFLLFRVISGKKKTEAFVLKEPKDILIAEGCMGKFKLKK